MSNGNSPDQQKCVIYARISESRDGLTAGVERQEAECRDLAARHGFAVAEVLTDNGISGWSGHDRPSFTRLLETIKRGGVAALIAWAPDRLARNLTDYAAVMDVCRDTSTRLLTVQGGEVSTDAVGSLSSGVQALVSSYESNIKSARVKAAAKQRALSGRPPGGPRKFGYTTDHMELIPVEAEALAAAVRGVLAGDSLRSWVKRLNSNPDTLTPARKGRTTGVTERRPWQTTSLRTTLQRPALAGIVVYDGDTYPDVPASWPPIITPTEHDQITVLLSGRATGPNETGGRPPAHLLSSLARCGVCGETMGTTMQNRPAGRVLLYRCRNAGERQQAGPRTSHVARRADYLDEMVTAAVVQRLQAGDIQAALAHRSGEDTGALLAERRRLQDALDDLATAVVRGSFTVSQAETMNRGYLDAMADVDARLTAADRSGVLQLVGSIVDPVAWWAAADLEGKRAVIDALVSVTVMPTVRGRGFNPEDVELTWRV